VPQTAGAPVWGLWRTGPVERGLWPPGPKPVAPGAGRGGVSGGCGAREGEGDEGAGALGA
jgi:hypothetical protein